MKKVIALCLSMVILVSCSVLSRAVDPLELTVQNAILMDATTGTVLYKKGEHQKRYPASVTKIMSLLLIFEALEKKQFSLQDEVVCSEQAAEKGGSQIWLEPGEKMTVDELLRATVIASANDACCALGELVAGSETGFVKMMNERAAELKMKDTHFDNCTGLDDDTKTHLSSAYDIAQMARALLKYDKVQEYSTKWMDTLRNGKTQLVNTNKLIRFYQGATGLKTGTTSKAGCCVCASAQREDSHFIAVVLGAKNSNDRFQDAKKLLDYGFAEYEIVVPKVDYTALTPVKVVKGVEQSITPLMGTVLPVCIKKGSQEKIEAIWQVTSQVQAPVKKGQKLGEMILCLNGEPLTTYTLTSPMDIEKVTFSHILFRLFASLCEGFPVEKH